MKNNLTNIVIVGRPNVGKSTLFNRLIQKRWSIVSDQPGVTRDRIYHKSSWLGKDFNLIDTGGIVKKVNLDFQTEINMQVDIAINDSQIVLFVVSGNEGVTSEDLFVASKLKRIKNKKVFLIVNKIDNKNKEFNLYDFYKLGFGEPIGVSSIHGIGISDLLEKIVSNIDENVFEEEDLLRIGIIGKPNVGKSTLVNTLLKQERVIVSNKAGTTRDAVDTKITYQNKDYIIVDTAGIKRNKRALNDIEFYSEVRANLTILNSDLVLLLLDYKNEIGMIDEKIMGILKDELKPTIVLINKVDQLDESDIDEANLLIKEKFKFAPWVEVQFISAKNKKNITKIFDKIIDIESRMNQQITTSQLNQFLTEIQILKKPPRFNGILIKLSYITYINNYFPHFIIFSNHPDKIHFSYQRFVENQLRRAYNFSGIPIKITYKKKN